ITHHALLEEVDQNQMFYYYDTVAASGVDLKQRTFRVESADEHRHMLSVLLKNSRYYIANRGYVNVPELTVGYDDISARFYEGAAAGTIMIGEAPEASSSSSNSIGPMPSSTCRSILPMLGDF